MEPRSGTPPRMARSSSIRQQRGSASSRARRRRAGAPRRNGPAAGESTRRPSSATPLSRTAISGFMKRAPRKGGVSPRMPKRMSRGPQHRRAGPRTRPVSSPCAWMCAPSTICRSSTTPIPRKRCGMWSTGSRAASSCARSLRSSTSRAVRRPLWTPSLTRISMSFPSAGILEAERCSSCASRETRSGSISWQRIRKRGAAASC